MTINDLNVAAAFAYDRKGYVSFDPLFSEHRNHSYSNASVPIFVSAMIRIDAYNPAYEMILENRQEFIKKQKKTRAKELENQIKSLNKETENLRRSLKNL